MGFVFRVVFRLLLLAAGLVFLLSLLAAGVILLSVWLLRGLWARLTGQARPAPWAARIDKAALLQRFYGNGFGAGPASRRGGGDVVDVEAVEVKATSLPK